MSLYDSYHRATPYQCELFVQLVCLVDQHVSNTEVSWYFERALTTMKSNMNFWTKVLE